ncbi:site-specific integrase [Pediococcus pentosaceus]|uniref:site-specific integrase n=1 Tax=Pediococcus pentosaceus TaxID=1255 RepID=UPI0021A8BC1C|nr:site-specific integrase [Pediococcus pentosaceus]MCT3033260.1 site-specific integrase [Pediococcus pentosaceus]
MASIKCYKTKNGLKRYELHMYGGINPQTGRPTKIHKMGFKTKKEASLAVSRLMLEIDNGELHTQEHILFKNVYDEWYETYINTVRISTYARTAAMFKNHILTEFGKLRIDTITTAQVQKAVNKWYKLAPVSGYKRWYHYTVNVFDFALLHKYMRGDNPAKMVVLPRKRDISLKDENFYNTEEIKTFFECIDSKKELEKYTLFRILCFNGIRRGECLALKWSDIDFRNSTLKISKTLTQGLRGETIVQPPKTKAGNRTISLDTTTLNFLRKWRLQQKKDFIFRGINTLNKDQLIFANQKNGFKSLNTPAKWQNKIIKDNNLKKITVHGWRHTSCALLFSIGISLKEVQKRLGHDDAQTTLNIYAHVTEQQDVETAEKLEHALDI